MIQRYLFASTGGVLIAFLLFLGMVGLIAVVDARTTEKTKVSIAFLPELKPQELTEEPRRLPELQENEMPDLPPLSPITSGENPNARGIIEDFVIDTGTEGHIINTGVSTVDTDTIPLVRVEPTYPIRAEERGIEGWVEVEFTISPRGTVVDPRVIAFEPSSIFNQAALRAVRRWKYNPKIVDGKPVSRPGIKVRLEFQLDTV